MGLLTLAGLRRAWRWLRLRPWLAVVVLMAAGQATAWQALAAEQDARQATQDAIEAHRCVDQHDRVGDLRSVIEGSVRDGSAAGAGAVFDVAVQLLDRPLPQDTGQRLERAVDERVRRAVQDRVAAYPDPQCDLAAARAALAEQGG